MKKLLWFVLAIVSFASIAVLPTSCDKDPVSEKEDPKKEDPKDSTDTPQPTSYADFIFSTEVNFDPSMGYSGTAIDLSTLKCDGKTIWEVFGLSSQDAFIAALGTQDVSSSATAQSDDATIFFIGIENSTKYVNETSSTTNGWGHWHNSTGDVCSWGDEAYFFFEAFFVGNANLEGIIGAHPGQVTEDLLGESFVFIEGFQNDDIVVAIEFHITLKEAEAPTVDIVGTKEIVIDTPYNADFAPISTGIDLAEIGTALGIDAADATIYGTNPDGSLSPIPATSFWFLTDGTVGAYGEGAAICLENNEGVWNIYLYPSEDNIGGSFEGRLTFVNSAYKGYTVTVKVNIIEQNTWSSAVTLTVEGAEVEGQFDIDAIAAYFEYDVAGLVTALQEGTVKMMPTNADGSYYLNADGTPNYSQVNNDDAKGVFYNIEGNCCNWYNETGDYYGHFYGTMYYGVYESEPYVAFCITPYAATEEQIGAYSFLMDLTNGEKTVHIVYNVTLESAVPWAKCEDKGGFVYEITMTPDNSYKALKIDINDDEMKTALGVEDLAAAISAEAPTVIVWGLNADGSDGVDAEGARWNSGEGPFGHWYNADGNVCAWGADGASMYFNVKADDGVYVLAGQFPDSGVIGNKYTMKQKFVAGEKTQVVTYNVSIVETL